MTTTTHLMPPEIDQLAMRRSVPFSERVVQGIVVTMDVVTMFICGIVSYAVIVGWSVTTAEYYISSVVIACLAFYALLKYADLNNSYVLMRPFSHLDRIVIAVGTCFLLLLATLFSLKVSGTFSRIWLAAFACSSVAAVCANRTVSWMVLKRMSDLGMITRNVVALGHGKQAEVLLKCLRERRPYFTTVLGLFVTRKVKDAEVEGYPVLGDVNALIDRIRSQRIDDVIVAMPWQDDKAILALLERLREVPVAIHLASDLMGFRLNLVEGFRSAGLTSSRFPDLPVVEISRRPISDWDVATKAAEDRILAALLLVAFSPIIILTALAIKLTSPGPVLYRQKRLGFNNQQFDILKFRSMRNVQEPSGPTAQATRSDPRVTAVGRIIRRLSIDELPQLLNVLSGTMSLVGPRPHALDHNQIYSQQIRGYFARHRVKPGLTGWAQVNGYRGETKDVALMEKRVQHDLFYVDNWSLGFDLRIILQTAVIVLSGKNAY